MNVSMRGNGPCIESRFSEYTNVSTHRPKEMQGRMAAPPERLGSCSKAVILLGNITSFIMNFLVGVWTRW